MSPKLPGLIADAFGTLFLAVPRGKRFAAARRTAILAAPLLRRLPAAFSSPLDGPRERALRLVLHSLRRRKVLFDPEIRVEGELPEGAVLVVSAHFLLTMLLIRRMLDAGDAPVVVARNPEPATCHVGTEVPIEYLKGDLAVLLRVRQKLGEGRKVFLALDASHPREGWPYVDTVAGRRWISVSAFELAEKIGVPVFFAAVSLDAGGRPAARLERAPRRKEDAVAAFAAFVAGATASMHR